jgi:hypothetical protein
MVHSSRTCTAVEVSEVGTASDGKTKVGSVRGSSDAEKESQEVVVEEQHEWGHPGFIIWHDD